MGRKEAGQTLGAARENEMALGFSKRSNALKALGTHSNHCTTPRSLYGRSCLPTPEQGLPKVQGSCTTPPPDRELPEGATPTVAEGS